MYKYKCIKIHLCHLQMSHISICSTQLSTNKAQRTQGPTLNFVEHHIHHSLCFHFYILHKGCKTLAGAVLKDCMLPLYLHVNLIVATLHIYWRKKKIMDAGRSVCNLHTQLYPYVRYCTDICLHTYIHTRVYIACVCMNT